MKDKPNYCYSSGCPLAEKGKGFALGCGNPYSKIGVMFERPAEDEIAYTFGGPRPPQIPFDIWQKIVAWQKEEYERRREAFPELDTDDQRRFLVRGAPVRGASGAEIRQWVLPYVGGEKEGLEGLFLENVLHCASKKSGEYPKGDERIAAEACCVHWNRLIPAPLRDKLLVYVPTKGVFSEQEVSPTEKSGVGHHKSSLGSGEVSVLPEEIFDSIGIAIWSLHPAGLLRDSGGGIVALPLQQDTFSKARAFAQQTSFKVLLLAGGKAAKFWSGFGEAVTKWCGHYVKETLETWQARMKRISEGLRVAQQLLIPKDTTTPKKTTTSRRGKAKEATQVQLDTSTPNLPPTTPETPATKAITKERKPRAPRKKKEPIQGMEAFGL
jgi:hypothetical protein